MRYSVGNFPSKIPPGVKFKLPVSSHTQKIAGKNRTKEVPTKMDKYTLPAA